MSVGTLKQICFKQNIDPTLRERYRRSYAVYYALIVTHWISIRIVWLLVRTPVTPNQVSVASYLCGWLAALYVSLPGSANLLVGAILFELFYVLDAVDGQLARAKGLASPAGAYLDDWANLIVPPVVVWGLGQRIYPALAPWCGFAAAFTMVSIPAIHALEARFAARAGVAAPAASLAPVGMSLPKKIYSMMYRACTMPVVMNLISLTAIYRVVSMTPDFDPSVLLVAYWGTVGTFIWITQGMLAWKRLRGGGVPKSAVLLLMLVFLAFCGAVVQARGPGKLRTAPAHFYCLAAGHDWRGHFSDDWLWHYNPQGSNFPHGYKYRYKENAVRCGRCGSVLFDRRIVDENILPIAEGEAVVLPPETTNQWNWGWHDQTELVSAFGPDGKVRSSWWYRNGRLHGPSRDFYSGNRVRNEWTAIGDELEGPARGYYPNGQLLWSTNFREGVPEGPSDEYYSNGVLKHRFVYKNGKIEGKSIQNYPSGRPRRTETYHDNRIEGMRYDYDENGHVVLRRPFLHGFTHGIVREYENERVLYERHFEWNKEVLRRKFGPDGSVIEESRPNTTVFNRLASKE